MHILVLCLKLEENQHVDQSLHIEKMLIIYSSQKKHSRVGILCSVLFYGCLICYAWLCGFITFLWLMMWLIVVGCRIPYNMGNIFYMASRYFNFLKPSHTPKNSVAVKGLNNQLLASKICSLLPST